ncbi:unnamed protein product [Spodoptera exigua]|nr:unnamed protein product [Spodoptera exigua]
MRTLKLLEDKIVLWNIQALRGQERASLNDKQLVKAYVDILDTYNINSKTFQIFDKATVITLSVCFWFGKDLVSQTIVTRQCEKLYLAFQTVHDSCTHILCSNCSEDERKLYKNVLRLHRASFSKIRVCSLFYVDAALQLSLMSQLTNYIVVLLQFAIL